MPKYALFHAMACIISFWLDLPQFKSLFEAPIGVPFPFSKHDTWRVAFFDASKATDSFPPFGRKANGRMNSKNFPALQHFCPEIPEKQGVLSVIESSSPHLEALQLEAQWRKEFTDVMENPIYARDIDLETRGPFGICEIE